MLRISSICPFRARARTPGPRPHAYTFDRRGRCRVAADASATGEALRATAVGFVSVLSRSPLHPVNTKANNRAMIRIRGLLNPRTVWRTATCLRWRLQFTLQPANIAGLHRVRRYNDFFDTVAFGAVERAKFESCRPRRDVGKPHANLAFWAAESLNCEQWDCGWVIGHCIPPLGQTGAQNSQSPVDAKVGR
jgi:hypothetical protein